ncbi:MAG TPA: adenylosuccinate synthase [Candidatus Dormibacteraeota bacterium]|nr:adenylosuccinate synthase [Candidatus Dormibacteraeota bacterium]
MSGAVIVVGVQWGDEGKGRIVDVLANDADAIARFGGGNNAGHTLVVEGRKVVLRSVPSGVFHAPKPLIVGAGVVIDLAGFVQELDELAAIGVDVSRVKLDERAHLTLPYHIALDRLGEQDRGAAAIGTTGRGIGPTYVDRVARTGVRAGDLRHPERLAERVRAALALHAARLDAAGAHLEAEAVVDGLHALAPRVLPHLVDGVALAHEILERGGEILCEGAQGTMLDIGFGTYPYVTSSHTIAGGACVGLGIGPTQVREVIGVTKAYCTRVGAGPFPSELHDAVGEMIRERGNEYGTNTGRPRRCGWFDAVAARYACRLNGVGRLVVTKLDVLTGLERVGIVTSYARDGQSVGVDQLGEEGVKTEVAWFPGWSEDVSGARRLEDLPPAARAYVQALEQAADTPVGWVSVGAERSALITV